MTRFCVALACLVVALASPASSVRAGAQAKPALGNTHPVYRELRSLAVGAEAYKVSNFVLTKDAAAFTLTGTLHMLSAVQGKVTGAVFLGQGSMAYTPPLAAERSMLSILTKGEPFAETFERAVFRFTDDTADAIKKGAAGTVAGPDAQAQDLLKDTNQALRVKLKDNLPARLLQDVLSPAPGRLFHAYISGKKYSSKLIYIMDPHGAGPVSPEEIQLVSWADFKEGIFAAHHYSDFYRTRQRVTPSPGLWIDIESQQLDVEIEGSGEISGVATTTFSSMIDGVAAVPLSLFPTLRVSSVTDADGKELPFIQESKEDDADFWIVLAKPANKGEEVTVRTSYKGKDAISDETPRTARRSCCGRPRCSSRRWDRSARPPRTRPRSPRRRSRCSSIPTTSVRWRTSACT